MNKSIKHIFIITVLFLLIVGVVSTASADDWSGTADQFLANLTDNITDNSTVTIHESSAVLDKNYTIWQNNIKIVADGIVTFENSNYSSFNINGSNVSIKGITIQNFQVGDNAAILWDDRANNGSLINCNFINNTLSNIEDGYGEVEWRGENGHLIGCKFYSNYVNGEWVDIIKWYSEYGFILSCEFVNNTIDSFDEGGVLGIYDIDNGTTISNCIFQYNRFINSTSECSALYTDRVDYLSLNNCTFKDNDKPLGCDIYISDDAASWTVSGKNEGIIGFPTDETFNTRTVCIYNNRTMGVTINQSILLSTSIQVGGFTIIDEEGVFNFTINGESIPSTMNGSSYQANYFVTGEIGDEFYISGNYSYVYYTEGVSLQYETALLIIKNSVSLTGDNMTFPYNKKIEVKLNATSEGANIPNGTVQVIIQETGDSFAGEVSNGKATINIPTILNVGTYHLKATYIENHDYVNDTIDLILNVIKANPTFNINNITYGDGEIIISTNSTVSGNVTITIDDMNKTIPIVNGTADLNITEWDLPAGNYSATIKYLGDKNYNSTITVINFTIKKDITITHIDVTETSADSVVIHLNLTDVKGKPITGNVTVNITSNKGYERLEVVSLVNGVGSLELTQLNDGIYNITATYNATVDYESSFNSSSFIINNTETEYYLNASDVVKYYKNGTQYTVKLTDNHGNPVVNQTILVTLNSSRWAKLVSYNITTNASGIARLDINLIAGEYSIMATFGNATPEINNITVLEVTFVLTANDVIKYFMNGTHYTVKVTSQYGYIIPNEAITVKIYSGKWSKPAVYTIKTNSSGIAKLDINLIAGIYTITSTVGKTTKYNNIAVFPTLTASSITKTLKQSANLKARLVDGQGNPVAGKEVKFTVKAKTYTFKTDANGIATLPIHLGLGTWSFLIASDNAQTRATVKVTK